MSQNKAPQKSAPSLQSPEVPEDPRQAPELLVEAALFSAGHPMSLEELEETTKLSRDRIQEGLDELQGTYETRRTSLAIVRSGKKWAMVLRPQFADESRHIVPPEIPFHVLRTLALIAYHQPLLQSELKDWVGSKVYEHVGILVDAGLVRKDPEGLTFALKTTSDFPEYFGIPADDAEQIRNFLAEQVGLIGGGSAPQTEDPAEATPVAPPVPGEDEPPL